MGPNPILGCLKTQTLEKDYLYFLFYDAGKIENLKKYVGIHEEKLIQLHNTMRKSSSTNYTIVVRDNGMHSTKFLDQM